MNPVLTREMRARWRGRSFVFLLGYLLLLAFAVVWLYGEHDTSQVNRFGASSGRASLGSMAQIGHDLFLHLTWMQTLCWMLLAPALTSTSIASEREHGLLEGVQLTPLAPWRIVSGKLLSALGFSALILLASLPIVAVCFLMGGVSPQEFAQALLLQIATATGGALIGLWCSSRSRRANSALSWTFGLIIAWGVSSFVGFILWDSGFTAPAKASLWQQLRHDLCGLLGQTNPILAALLIANPQMMRMGGAARVPGISILAIDAPAWAISSGFQLALGALLFWLATRAVRKPLPDPLWLEPSKKSRQKPLRRRTRTKRGEQSQSEDAADDEQAMDGSASRPVSKWDLPLTAFIRSSNPVFQREARSKFRLRRMPLPHTLAIAAVGLLVLYWYLRLMRLAFATPGSRASVWSTICILGAILLMVVSTLLGAGAFARERESRTWDGLRLSLLTRPQLIAAKLLAPLLACLIYSMPLWPLLALCLLRDGITGQWSPGGVAIEQALGTVGVLAATAWFCTAWAMWVSWRCRRVVVAVGWSMVTLFFAFVLMPVFLTIEADSSRATEQFLMLWHPIFAIIEINSSSQSNPYYTEILARVVWCVIFLLAAGGALLLSLFAQMRREKGNPV